ncbi:Bifunctional inhibitor/plant lipid transfer protein/seed storage helical domain [Macleaya cordata]|uniref:Bifunctional inhibitor/plant lipid transfer protein/seed storage helical domain n=1 Tax=Macleaya cordata TaxID=56857 RepID=A0A200PTF2_MACCD|nr:Bifunctional inhibitor/plant lipid transfer protein/seed storage helical domain [Macleaya cordata]
MVESFNIRFLALVVLVILTLSSNNISNGVLGQGGCEGQFQGLAQQCSQYVLKTGPKTPPSKGCCDLIKKADVPCICKHVTKEIEQIVSMEKMVYVAGYCGKPLPHGSKCGSFTIPPV